MVNRIDHINAEVKTKIDLSSLFANRSLAMPTNKFRHPSFMQPPRISALMLVGKHPSRINMARHAVQAFLNQTYPNKELIIVNNTVEYVQENRKVMGYVLTSGVPNISEHVVSDHSLSTGQLRNIALSKASGEYCIQWDDDEWHDLNRMMIQMACVPDKGCVVLKNQIRFNSEKGTAIYKTDERGLPSTILFPKPAFEYPDVRIGEDYDFLNLWKTSYYVLDNQPSLSISFFHGQNLTNEEFFMEGKMALGKGFISQRDAKQLASVLGIYGYQLSSRIADD